MTRVDLDAYVHAHAHEWQRLEELTRRRRLSGDESDELVNAKAIKTLGFKPPA